MYTAATCVGSATREKMDAVIGVGLWLLHYREICAATQRNRFALEFADAFAVSRMCGAQKNRPSDFEQWPTRLRNSVWSEDG